MVRAMNDKQNFKQSDKLSSQESEFLLEHLSSAISQEVPLDEVFRALAEDAPERRLRRVARLLSEHLEKGVSFEEALTATSKILPAHMKRALIVGAESGNLPQIVVGLSNSELARREMKRGLRSVLSYPLLVCVVLTLVMLMFAIWVVPSFEAIYADFELDLPNITVYTISLANALPTLLVFLLAFVAVILGMLTYFKRFTHWMRTALPLFGTPWIWCSHHEFATLMSTLTQSEVPITTALDCTVQSLRDRHLAWAAEHINQKCKEGMPLSQGLQESIHFDPTLVALVKWGEANQSLPASLREAAQQYEHEMQHYEQFLHRICPPIMLTFVASALFMAISSLILPMFDMLSGWMW